MEADRSLRILLWGGDDLADCGLGASDGGNKLTLGLADLLADRAGPDFHVIVSHVTQRSELSAGELPFIEGGMPNVVVLSLGANFRFHAREPFGAPRAELAEKQLEEAIGEIKKQWRSHVLCVNASTVDPQIQVSNYSEIDGEPRALFAQRLNVALIRLSHQEGISVIDADRIVAEMGGGAHVAGFLDYSAAAAAAICTEIVRVIEDYGFLDERPLVAQTGGSFWQGQSNPDLL